MPAFSQYLQPVRSISACGGPSSCVCRRFFFFAFPHLFSLLQGKDFDLKQRVTRAASFLNPSWNRLVSNGAEVGGSPVHLP